MSFGVRMQESQCMYLTTRPTLYSRDNTSHKNCGLIACVSYIFIVFILRTAK